jgi:hypothetical protein
MSQNQKIAVVVRDDLQDWQKLNVVAFLASSVAIEFPETHGKAFITASGNSYLSFINQPMLVYKAEELADLKRAFLRAKERGLKIGIYTKPLFATKSEAENIVEISKLSDEQQDLVGIVVYGDGKLVSKALDGLKFHP